MIEKPFLSDVSHDALQAFCKTSGVPAFRAKQIADWIYRRAVTDPEKMDNLPKTVREELAHAFVCNSTQASDVFDAPDGSRKYVLELFDNECVEAVAIPAPPDRLTLCLSSQVGCPVRCRFCASGMHGLKRNLYAGEILDEYFTLTHHAGMIPTNLVYMGIGEPLLNFENVALSIDRLTSQDYCRFSPRRITVSTSGITEGIYKLAQLDKPLYLALSLHATDDRTRAEIIPDAFREPLDLVLKACEAFTQTHNRLVTLEYALVDGLNMSETQARELAQIAIKLHAKINLIPYNPVEGVPFKQPSRNGVMRFFQAVENAGAQVTIRWSKGGAANAACGQLRARHNAESKA